MKHGSHPPAMLTVKTSSQTMPVFTYRSIVIAILPDIGGILICVFTLELTFIQIAWLFS